MPTRVRRWMREGISDRLFRLGVKPFVFAVSLIPAASWAWAAVAGQLDSNPFNALIRSTGLWSLRLLCLTLAVTPFRWLTGWHRVVGLRRMVGLFGFFYAVVHVVAYIMFDPVAAVDAAARARPWDAAADVVWAIGVDLVRPFFATGWVAFVLLVPLAATSTAGMIRRLGGRRWQAVHRLAYVATIASVVHGYWPLSLPVERYEILLATILALRMARAYARRPPMSSTNTLSGVTR
jgi:methionine sulfoxide reductase heme-binding subunit